MTYRPVLDLTDSTQSSRMRMRAGLAFVQLTMHAVFITHMVYYGALTTGHLRSYLECDSLSCDANAINSATTVVVNITLLLNH